MGPRGARRYSFLLPCVLAIADFHSLSLNAQKDAAQASFSPFFKEGSVHRELLPSSLELLEYVKSRIHARKQPRDSTPNRLFSAEPQVTRTRRRTRDSLKVRDPAKAFSRASYSLRAPTGVSTRDARLSARKEIQQERHLLDQEDRSRLNAVTTEGSDGIFGEELQHLHAPGRLGAEVAYGEKAVEGVHVCTEAETCVTSVDAQKGGILSLLLDGTLARFTQAERDKLRFDVTLITNGPFV
ncbi:hypothetical protein BESB_066940 [Besnoitia besnoiti]|uniref:Uncharacterized protein n=1 Tax=Besnoitia besnoiti TaxID=94643 RepID=A0A2A9MEG3_BESBE|nr:hypothetical protein BESB_066940 [Besnoitia besnoiti]PFH34661.1 hypothetical protein BESB_066940 [Besnoitia besnoiti]